MRLLFLLPVLTLLAACGLKDDLFLPEPEEKQAPATQRGGSDFSRDPRPIAAEAAPTGAPTDQSDDEPPAPKQVPTAP